MEKHVLRHNWIETGIAITLLMLFLILYSGVDRWVIQTLPSTVSPVFFPKVITLLCIFMSITLVFFRFITLKKSMETKKINIENFKENGQHSFNFII